MKKLLLLIILLLSLKAVAQHGKGERIKALKISFITEHIDLTEKEAQKFWPLYNEHENKLNAIRHDELRSIRKEIHDNLTNMTDKEAEELLSKLNDAEKRMHTLELEFPKKLSGILSPKKIIRLRMAEEEFKRQMLEEFKRRRKERG